MLWGMIREIVGAVLFIAIITGEKNCSWQSSVGNHMVRVEIRMYQYDGHDATAMLLLKIGFLAHLICPSCM